MTSRRTAVLALAALSLVACKRPRNRALDDYANRDRDAGVTLTSAAAPTADPIPPPAPGKGQIKGTVTWAGEPVAGVTAKLCTTFSTITVFSGCGGNVYYAKTDANGRYVIKDVPPGTYAALLVQVFDTTTYQYSHNKLDFLGATKHDITAGATSDAGETSLVKEDVAFTTPHAMARTTSMPTLQWRAVPKATHYAITLRPAKGPSVLGEATTTSFTPKGPLSPGRWKVDITAQKGTLDLSELKGATFIVPDEDDKAPLDDAAPIDPPARVAAPDLPALTPAAGTGALRGRVFFDDKPLAKIDVRLCETYDPYWAGCGGKILSLKTDANGVYTFLNVKPGSWGGLTVRGLDGHTLYMASKIVGAESIAIADGEVTEQGITNLRKSDLKIGALAKKQTTRRFPISWTAYPNATSYKLTISDKDSRAIDGYGGIYVSTSTFWLDLPLDDGAYNASVTAYNANGTAIANSASDRAFNVKAK